MTATLTAPARDHAATPAPVSRRATRDAFARVLLTGALGSALAMVTWWWAADGGLSDLGGWAIGLTSLGRLTGLVASILLLTQVVLMVRVPLIEGPFGQDRLARIHRWVGFTSFTLMLAHIGLISWGYAGGTLPALPGTAWDLTLNYPGMLLAAAGTLATVMVVVTSVRAARRRLRYESWHLLHLYAYLGVGLALPHQLWTGQQFTASPARTVFWWTAWGTVVGLVLGFRVAVPLWRTWRHRVEVTHVVEEAPGLVSIHMRGRDLDRLSAQAGQFFTWRFLGRDGWTRGNPFSLSAAPDGHTLRITAQAVGDGSRSLATLAPGTRVVIEGPHGRLSARTRTRPGVALIGAGAGMAPIRALAEGLPYAPGEAVLVERFRTAPLFEDEVDDLAARRGLRVVRTGGPRRSPTSWLGEFPLLGDSSGAVPETLTGRDDRAVLVDLVPDIAERDVYLCGPDGWTDSVRADLRRAGVPDRQVHVESFRW